MGIVTTIAPVALALIMLGLGAALTVKDAPNPNMISAKAIGAIVVTIPMTPLCNINRYNVEDFYN